MSRVTSAPILPATVVAAHLESCAVALAGARFAGPDDIAVLVPVLARAQRQLAIALNNLALRSDGRPATGPWDIAQAAEVPALTEVLAAASDAADSAADALAEALPLLENPAGDDTRS
jgi:hypothetical protein